MNPGAIELTWWDLALSTLLVITAGLVSVSLGLKLERRLVVASVRTVVQLLLIGYILKWVFGLSTWWAIAPVILVMIGAASQSAVARSSRTFSGAMWRAFVTLFLCGLLTAYVVTRVIIDVHPWYEPQYLIPLLGMILGNSLNGISLCLDQLLESLEDRRAHVELELALGASRWEAAQGPIADCVRRGMIPIINSMMVVGLVSLPGMMTGQILAGTDPLQAVKYQIVVMFMIAAATSLGCIGMSLFIYRRLFNGRHQLVEGAIRRKGN